MRKNKTSDVNLSVLKNASITLKKFLQHKTTEQEKAGIVQAFEFCYELSWKVLKRVLYNEGTKANSPKEVFREAGVLGLLSDVKLWFDFIEIRNKTVHTYNELILETIIKIVPKFYKELEKLIVVLEERTKI